MIAGLLTERETFDSPIKVLSMLISGREISVALVDEDVAEAVACAIEAGITWGTIAGALRAT
jgi:hypothetical protein